MKILYFASLREKLDKDQEVWTDLHGINSPKGLLVALQKRGEPWTSAFNSPQLIVSINQEVATLDSKIKLDDEVAFFPPVTGG